MDQFAEAKTERIKLVVVGDSRCGKTSLLCHFCFNPSPDDYAPIVFETRIQDILVDGQQFEILLCDTQSQSGCESSRSLIYKETDVVLLCFEMNTLKSLDSVYEKWYPEVQHFCPDATIIVVGCKKDLRGTFTSEQGMEVVERIGADEYVECSTVTREDVIEVFETAIKRRMQ